ncbi:hypothetical protein HK096_000456 [Nowakowskiella sp. JEL0078]|nr:hypothetical protein HK096_000456 [Nowakowskiella sp. JEL0078]
MIAATIGFILSYVNCAFIKWQTTIERAGSMKRWLEEDPNPTIITPHGPPSLFYENIDCTEATELEVRKSMTSEHISIISHAATILPAPEPAYPVSSKVGFQIQTANSNLQRKGSISERRTPNWRKSLFERLLRFTPITERNVAGKCTISILVCFLMVFVGIFVLLVPFVLQDGVPEHNHPAARIIFRVYCLIEFGIVEKCRMIANWGWERLNESLKD